MTTQVSKAQAMASAADDDEGRKEDMEQKLIQLGIQEGDLDDVVFEDFAEEAKEISKWLTIVRVYTQKSYRHAAFFRSMRAAWDLSRETRFTSLEKNLYSIRFKCLAEWEKAMEGGP